MSAARRSTKPAGNAIGAGHPDIDALLAACQRLLGGGSFALRHVRDRTFLVRLDGLVIALGDIARILVQTESMAAARSAVDALAARFGSAEVVETLGELAAIERDLSRVKRFRNAGPRTLASSASGITLMVSQTCNLACRYCYGGGGTYGSSTALMSEETALAGIDLLLARAPREAPLRITFFGGEPLLNFRLIHHVVDHCRSLDRTFRFSMTTNGTVFSDQIGRFLKANDFRIMVSLDGDGAIHDFNRPFKNGKGSYGRVLRTLRRLQQHAIPFQLRATLTTGTAAEETIAVLREIADEMGAVRLVLAPVDVVAGCNKALERVTLRRLAVPAGSARSAEGCAITTSPTAGAVFVRHEPPTAGASRPVWIDQSRS